MADQESENQPQVAEQEEVSPAEGEPQQEQVEAGDENQSNIVEGENAPEGQPDVPQETVPEEQQEESQDTNQNAETTQEEAQETDQAETAAAAEGEAAQEEVNEQQETEAAAAEETQQAEGEATQEATEEVTETQDDATEEQAADEQPGEQAGAEEVPPAEESAAAEDVPPADETPPAEDAAVAEEQVEAQGEEQTDAPAPEAEKQEGDTPPQEPEGEEQTEATEQEPVAAPEPTEEEQDQVPAEEQPETASEQVETQEVPEEPAETAQPEEQEAEAAAEEAPEAEAEPAQEEETQEAADETAPVEAPPSPAMVETEAKEPAMDGQKEALTPRKPGVNLDSTATVKFVLMPSGQVVTVAFTLGQTLGELKSHFAMELKMPTNLIMLLFDGKGMTENTTLADLGVGPNGTVQLEMQSADPVNNPLKPYRPRQEYHMPDVITVRVMTEDCEAKDVVVEIERSRTKKPFLGGFRNKNTGVEYHNASAQTAKKPRPPPTTERFCRDTQTCEQKNILQQTTNTTSTQMTGVGVYITNSEDKLITPGKYFTADDHWSMILRNVIILQKYYRRWLAKRYVQKLKEDKAKRLEWERQEELRKKKEKEDRIKRDYARRINPKTKADFDMLNHCLEKWRQEELERINSTLTGAERKAAMCMLLDQETELLSAIERHKNEANSDNKEKRIMAFLDKAAAPKKWQGHDGNLTYMDTPYTIRAKELRDIYNSINMKYLTQDERLDVLLTLKHTVKEHDCKLTQEIIELIDREADLLMRGVKEGNLTGLRKRISTLFLQYIKTPTFNPEAAKLLKVPQDPSLLRKDINYCHSCGSYLPSTEFFITSNSKHVGRCRKCQKIENDGRQREDHTYFKIMLKALRKSEEAMQDGSSICYLLQETDLRYLVENIWSNQSILSAWNDLYDLVLVRWDKRQEWSPWNCILLTHDEAEAHKKLFNLEEGYGHVFIHKVTQKHNFARNYFSRLPGMAEILRQKMGSRDLESKTGPSVAGHSVPKAQKV